MHVGSFFDETEVKSQRIDAAGLASFQTLFLIAKAEIEWQGPSIAFSDINLEELRKRLDE